MHHELEASSLPCGRGGATGICLLISHTGIDLESIEAVILFVIVWQDVNSALHKSPTRFFAVYEFSYTSVPEMRPADELLCRCLYAPYVVVVVCYLEATALHCLVALCGCPCLVLAVLGCWPFWGGGVLRVSPSR